MPIRVIPNSVAEMRKGTFRVYNRDTRYVVFDQHVNHVHNGSVHICRCHVLFLRDDSQLAQRFPQLARLAHINGDKLENAKLCQHRNNHFLLRLIIDINKWDSAGAASQHATTGIKQRHHRVHRHRLNLRGTYSLLDFYMVRAQGRKCQLRCPPAKAEYGRVTAETVEAEPINLRQLVWVLPIVLNNIDIVG